MKRDALYLNEKLTLLFIAFIEDNFSTLSDNQKTHILVRMIRKYESEQTFKKILNHQKITTGNTEDEVKEWLENPDNTEPFIKRRYRDECSIAQIALMIYQVMREHETIIQMDYPDYHITIDKLLLWQNTKTPELSDINNNFLEFLTANYPKTAQKLRNIQLPDNQYYCRILNQFGIKYYTEDNVLSEYAKLQITAEWFTYCKEIRHLFWDLYEGFIIDESEYYDDFAKIWNDEDTLPERPEKDQLLYTLVINLPSMKSIMQKINEKENKKIKNQMEKELEKKNIETDI